ncbi:MAG: signal peptidase I [Bacteroidales bacterium]|nr:signal peptidase I [Bacteroidales bacterium]
MEVENFLIGIGIGFGIFFVGIMVLMIIAKWKVYEKANQPGWAVLIPIYNTLVFLQIVGKPWWWLFLMLIPYVNLIFIVWASNMLSKSFGKEEAFTVGIVLLPYVFYPIIAFSKDINYLGPAGTNFQYETKYNN